MTANGEETAPMSGGLRLEHLLDVWKDARRRGESLSAEELCSSFPELIPELERRMQNAAAGDRPAETAPEQAGTEEATLQSVSELTELQFHDKGGLGVVYRATERELSRQVAVKFIHRALVGNAESRSRFLMEAEVTGRLEHPGIVPLYGLGEADNGRLFYYMRFIEGETMDKAIVRCHELRSRQEQSSDYNREFRRLLTAFISVCRTVAYAHNRGIVHRDLKPANVMLGKFGETIVVDWGLAIPVDRDERFRSSGELTLMPTSGSQTGSSTAGGAGTLAYMSPEQASNLAPTPASDLYSLGATLYKILCGQPAFSGDDGHEIRKRVIEGRFLKPSEILKTVPRALEAICLKAMKQLPGDRYITALDLAADVDNYLADEPVSVLKDTPLQRSARWVRQHRMAAQAAGAGIAMVVVVSTLAAAWMGSLARSESAARLHADQSHLAAELARQDNLKTTARTMAQAIGYEIDLRWRLLEAEAGSETLRKLLIEAGANPEDPSRREPLQAWLNERRLLKGMTIRSSNWSVFSATGIQLARSPRARSIGQTFRHRDYFHGLGKDLEKESPEVASVKPLEYLAARVPEAELVHLSCVFMSTATNRLAVAFSVPVWSRETDAEIIGLLSMTLEIDDFGLPANALLFETEENQITHRRGTVIAHGGLARRTDKSTLPTVTPEALRWADEQTEDSLTAGTIGLFDHFRDPLTGEEKMAAMAPVVISSRSEEVGTIGWVLVVREE